MESDKNAQIIYRIREETPYGRYSDSLYFTQEAWNSLTQEELDALIQQRVDGWIAAITAPVQPYIPNEVDLVSEKGRIANQLLEAENRLIEYFPPKSIDELTEAEILAKKQELEAQMAVIQAKLAPMTVKLEAIAVEKAAEPKVIVKG